jgi:hypothetical protein
MSNDTEPAITVSPIYSGCFLTTKMTVRDDTLSPLSEYGTRSGEATRVITRTEIVRLIADLSAALVQSGEMWQNHLIREHAAMADA